MLLPEDVKVLLGDNLAAHLSPDVLKLCQQHNIRFCFLPENSTHLMQPLDVGVFGPMKRYWREILRDWKEECDRKDIHFATLPKTVRTWYRTVYIRYWYLTFISKMAASFPANFFYYLGNCVAR
jgi:hypothetical protein